MEAPQEANDLNSLEDPETVVDDNAKTGGTSGNSAAGNAPELKKKKKFRPKDLITHINIYLLLFIFIVILASAIVFIGIQRNKTAETPEELATQELTAEELDKINGSEAKVGDPKQTLSIESNAIFTGKVLIRDSLDVAGTIKVGGSLSLPGITVSGTSNFDQIQANNLSIAGDTNVQGQLSVQKTLTVTGGASFGGPISAPSINIERLSLNNDLQLNRHIDTGGGTPSISSGGAIGAGGTSSVSGGDTAGTITINPGGGAGNGPVATINFSQNFSQTPHIVVTPVGRYVQFYITRNTSSFTIFVVGGISPGSFSLDYIAFD